MSNQRNHNKCLQSSSTLLASLVLLFLSISPIKSGAEHSTALPSHIQIAESVGSCGQPNIRCVPSEYPTIQLCLNSAQPGDTCLLSYGTYAGFTTVRDGTATGLITISGTGASSTVIQDSKIYMAHGYHKLTGIRLQGHYLQMTGHHSTIEGNEFTGATQGIYMQSNDSSFNLITNNTFYEPSGNGMVVLAGHDNIVAHNTFRDGLGYDALRVWGQNQSIKNNSFFRIIADQGATHGNHADIIQSFKTTGNNPAKNIVFEQNYIRDCTSQFGNLTGGGTADMRDWTFRNNIFINSRIQLNNYLPDVKVYNNTVYGTPALNTTGFRFTGSGTRGYATNGKVFNNIFIGDGGFYSGSVQADNNIIANLNGSPKSAPGEGHHGINGGFNPQKLFVDVVSSDFRLRPGSLAINAGADLSSTGFNSDITGVSRPQGLAWDIGAYEYYSGQPMTPHDTLCRIVILSHVLCHISPPLSVYGNLTCTLLPCPVFGECYKLSGFFTSFRKMVKRNKY